MSLASAYGKEGHPGDANDNWRVHIVSHDPSDPESYERVRAIHTKFKLIHDQTGCELYSHKVKLPEWGFEQQEVTCIKEGIEDNAIWVVDANRHPQSK